MQTDLELVPIYVSIYAFKFWLLMKEWFINFNILKALIHEKLELYPLDTLIREFVNIRKPALHYTTSVRKLLSKFTHLECLKSRTSVFFSSQHRTIV